MKPERWQQIKVLLQSALEREPDERSAFLVGECAGDDRLRSEVESLIISHERAGNFIEEPAVQVMAGLIADDQDESLEGTSFGPYQISARLGTGGMGEVYLAQDSRLARRVALKLLPSDFTKDEERVRRFQLEARAASALNHPNILTIYEIGEIDSRHFIATEHIEGMTLREQMATGPMKVSEALDVAVQVVSALTAAHEAGIIHRDIKPDNIMIRRDGYVKVLDFGLAKLTERKTGESEATTLVHTKQGMVMGTAHYMSPEQARGLAVDARTDIFSLGVVLYEMVAGRTPFEGETMMDVLVSILEKEPPPLARDLPESLKELQRIVTKTLSKNVDGRYQTSKDLLADLKSLREELEFEAKLEASSAPDRSDRLAVPNSDSHPIAGTAQELARKTAKMSSAEYLMREIKRHRVLAASIVAILVLTTAAIVYSSLAGRGEAIDSVAILPFVNASSDENAEYLSDGISESIIYNLSQLSHLKVMSRGSVLRYKGKETDPQTVGRELGVRAVMTGRVIQRGDTLMISAELVDVRDNRMLWGQQYNRRLSDILAVQGEISREISEKLRLRLTGEEQRRLTKHSTENTEAYRLYLKGRYYWNKRTEEGYRKGIEQFQQAIELDPNFALAYSGLADCYQLFNRFGVVPPKETMARAKAAATKAMEIDDQLAEAQTSMAYIRKEYDWDFQGAGAGLRRAIELNPNYGIAHHWYAIYLAETEERYDEALAEIRRAQELEPLSLIVSTDTGMILYLARRYDEAIEQGRKTLELDPNFFRAHLWLGRALERKGRYQEAIAEFQTARQLDDKPFIRAWLGQAYAASGKTGEARKVLDELKQLSKQMYVDSYYVAAIHVALGERDHAFASLEQAYQDRSGWLSRLKVDPIFEALHSDPRFNDLLRRIGLAP